MSLAAKEEFRCSHCGAVETVTVYDSINVANDPQLKEKVKNGSLFIWECPDCGSLNLAPHQTLYHDPDNKLMVWYTPENVALSQEQMNLFGEKLKDYTLRRTEDIGSLIEKVSIHDAGLDDVVIEMCKYVTKMELAESPEYRAKARSLLETPFKFYKLNGADNEIVLSFPDNGEMKVLNIGFNVYEDCKRILERNPSVKPEPGFAKVDAAWLSTIFR